MTKLSQNSCDKVILQYLSVSGNLCTVLDESSEFSLPPLSPESHCLISLLSLYVAPVPPPPGRLPHSLTVLFVMPGVYTERSSLPTRPPNLSLVTISVAAVTPTEHQKNHDFG